MPDAAAAKPLRDQAACLQEQYTVPLPMRNERPMTEILKERLAQVNPASQCPVFVP
jgi:hypothetical protein